MSTSTNNSVQGKIDSVVSRSDVQYVADCGKAVKAALKAGDSAKLSAIESWVIRKGQVDSLKAIFEEGNGNFVEILNDIRDLYTSMVSRRSMTTSKMARKCVQICERNMQRKDKFVVTKRDIFKAIKRYFVSTEIGLPIVEAIAASPNYVGLINRLRRVEKGLSIE